MLETKNEIMAQDNQRMERIMREWAKAYAFEEVLRQIKTLAFLAVISK